MPAYPFAQAPTIGELIQKFTEDFGATLEHTSPLVGPRGEVAVRYLKRDTDDGLKVSERLPDEDDAPVGWDQVRRLCRQLGIGPRELNIGLDLG